MNHYLLWFNLKNTHQDLEFSAALDAYLGRLQADGFLHGFALTRRKLGFGPETLGEFQVTIDTVDLERLDAAFSQVARRSGEMEELHKAVYSQIKDMKTALYRDFPDPERQQAGISEAGVAQPTGHFYDLVPDTLKRLNHSELIEAFVSRGTVPADAIRGLSNDQLCQRPIPGTWSIQEIVIHLMDSDLYAADRIKRILAEDHPLLQPYPESEFATRLQYQRMDVHQAAELFRLQRQWMGQLLRITDESAFQRKGRHSEFGDISILQLVHAYIHHVDHHLEFIERKRGMLT